MIVVRCFFLHLDSCVLSYSPCASASSFKLSLRKQMEQIILVQEQII